jgi:hypothetical protein
MSSRSCSPGPSATRSGSTRAFREPVFELTQQYLEEYPGIGPKRQGGDHRRFARIKGDCKRAS